jgi:hypothetical protein
MGVDVDASDVDPPFDPHPTINATPRMAAPPKNTPLLLLILSSYFVILCPSLCRACVVDKGLVLPQVPLQSLRQSEVSINQCENSRLDNFTA